MPASSLPDRAALVDRWRTLLGPFPAERVPLTPQWDVEDRRDGFVRRKVRYQIEDGVTAEAYVLTPDRGTARGPAVVVFHQTTRSHIDQAAGVDSSVPELAQGVQLVRQGYVVLCPRCFLFDDGAVEAVGFARNVAAMQARHPDWTGLTRMTWDAIRAADFLGELPEVDPTRIGCIGHSLGAREAFYAAAFDPRYRVAVCNEGGLRFAGGHWDRVWYLGPQVNAPGFAGSHHDLVAMIAPRGLLLLAGDSADDDASREFLERGRPLYAQLGAEDGLQWVNHHGGHRYPPEARAAAEAFLARHLR